MRLVGLLFYLGIRFKWKYLVKRCNEFHDELVYYMRKMRKKALRI